LEHRGIKRIRCPQIAIFIRENAPMEMMTPSPEVSDPAALRDIPQLVALLGSPDPDERGEAAFALVQIGAAAVPLLVEAYDQGGSMDRTWIAAVLGQIGDVRGVEPLVRALQDGDADLRVTAARALGMIPSEEAVGSLIEVLRDHDPFVRSASATALGMLRAKKAVDALGNALRDEKKPVRVQAAWALDQIGDPAALPYLEKARKDPDPVVQKAVERAIRSITP
jgi:HEAT repeat protein